MLDNDINEQLNRIRYNLAKSLSDLDKVYNKISEETIYMKYCKENNVIFK